MFKYERPVTSLPPMQWKKLNRPTYRVKAWRRPNEDGVARWFKLSLSPEWQRVIERATDAR